MDITMIMSVWMMAGAKAVLKVVQGAPHAFILFVKKAVPASAKYAEHLGE